MKLTISSMAHIAALLIVLGGCGDDASQHTYQGKTASEWAKLANDRDGKTSSEAWRALNALYEDSDLARSMVDSRDEKWYEETLNKVIENLNNMEKSDDIYDVYDWTIVRFSVLAESRLANSNDLKGPYERLNGIIDRQVTRTKDRYPNNWTRDVDFLERDRKEYLADPMNELIVREAAGD